MCLALPFGVAPLAVDNVFLGHLRLYLHQFVFHEVLDIFHPDGLLGEMRYHLLGDTFYFLLLEVDAGCLERFTDGIGDFGGRKVLLLSVAFDDTDFCQIHFSVN